MKTKTSKSQKFENWSSKIQEPFQITCLHSENCLNPMASPPQTLKSQLIQLNSRHPATCWWMWPGCSLVFCWLVFDILKKFHGGEGGCFFLDDNGETSWRLFGEQHSQSSQPQLRLWLDTDFGQGSMVESPSFGGQKAVSFGSHHSPSSFKTWCCSHVFLAGRTRFHASKIVFMLGLKFTTQLWLLSCFDLALWLQFSTFSFPLRTEKRRKFPWHSFLAVQLCLTPLQRRNSVKKRRMKHERFRSHLWNTWNTYRLWDWWSFMNLWDLISNTGQNQKDKIALIKRG